MIIKLPNHIESDIINYILEKCMEGVSRYDFASEDEDTVTGDFLRGITTKNAFKLDNWIWKIEYRKFRGRGPNAFEKTIGADGILQMKIDDGINSQVKGLLFQAKNGFSANGKTRSQIIKMESFAPNGSAIFVYEDGGYFAANGTKYLTGNEIYHNLCKFLIEFIKCNVGLIDLFYNFTNKNLYTTDFLGEKKFLKTTPKHTSTIIIKKN